MTDATTGRLAGKAVIVTGGGSGLGAAGCRRFAAEGAHVVVVDLDGDSARAVADEIGARGGGAVAVAADVATEAGNAAMVDAARDAFGGVDALWCNAGLSAVGTAVDVERSTWDRALAVMLTGVWLGMRAVLPTMVARGSGSIVNQSSIAALVGFKSLAAYAAAKAGVVGLTRQAAIDFAADGVRVNAICPGMVPTPLVAATYAEREARGASTPKPLEARMEEAAARYPLGRLGDPLDVAEMAVFLASDEAAWITGQVFTVDGGYTAR